MGKGPISQAGARGVRVLTEADLFSTQPLDPARSLVTRDDLLTLPVRAMNSQADVVVAALVLVLMLVCGLMMVQDRVDVTLSCGKRYLCGGGGSKAMLQWLDTIGSSGGGPPSSARFILERAVDGGSRYCYRLRLRDSRRYVSLGGEGGGRLHDQAKSRAAGCGSSVDVSVCCLRRPCGRLLPALSLPPHGASPRGGRPLRPAARRALKSLLPPQPTAAAAASSSSHGEIHEWQAGAGPG